jgi:hypothetical protein
MTRKLLIALALTFFSAMAAAQSGADRGGAQDRTSPPSTTPSGTQPATPAEPADPGMSPATPATPATPGKTGKTGKAAGKAKAGGEKFGQLDANGDGNLSRDELKAEADINARFSELDTNRDGKLSTAEFAAFEASATPR